METNDTKIALLQQAVGNIKEKIKDFVSIDRFKPVEKIVWTLVTLLVISVVGAIIKLVLE